MIALNNPQSSFSTSVLAVSHRVTSFLVAAGITLAILFLMTQMISNDMPALEKEEVVKLPNIHFVKEPPVVETIKSELPEAKEPPLIPQAEFTKYVDGDDVVIDFTPTDSGTRIDPFMQTSLPGGMAMVPISPRFPEVALQRGLCGHVIVQFDISAAGLPTNVQVLESSSRLFERSAISAVERARYKPHQEGGKPAAVYGKQEKISFILDDGC